MLKVLSKLEPEKLSQGDWKKIAMAAAQSAKNIQSLSKSSDKAVQSTKDAQAALKSAKKDLLSIED